MRRISPEGSNGSALRVKPAIIVSALVVGLALVLLAMGRLPMCACGTIKLWNGARVSPENSQQLFDWWSLSHVVHGFLFYGFLRLVAGKTALSTRFIAAVCIEGAWEIFENSNFIIERYRDAGALDYFGDSVVNSLCDVFSMMMGFAAAMRLPVRASLAVVAALELAALVMIRDNLTLNIIMLTYPFDAIRQWQAG